MTSPNTWETFRPEIETGDLQPKSLIVGREVTLVVSAIWREGSLMDFRQVRREGSRPSSASETEGFILADDLSALAW